MAVIEKLTKVKRPLKKNASETDALAKLDKELQTQLAYLRHSAKEIARIYAANLERDLLDLSDAIKSLVQKEGNRKGTRRILEQLTEINDRVSLKPVKGRKKDLTRIEKTVTRMTRAMAKKKSAK
ncbi:MAG: hypothetical protein QME74_11295 [Candidatus Edwardsbacteria bacterium]|nr:hypothetical protein [Candidatus Edwardsbacteria bacterium]